ncbi:TetR/AcrR family transcriptional regulator [Novosphingobium beihaiensis]|uniref:TetR/AcrR family transcriptional regulator n=1 Tax=Novosphingobium beihaiensis TaxID=2930389 RepID=A0ABT0BTP4_9SPHN|nr:TetR/AcrR family transcriptional regulator [Novosphingobium beihaiensis]MCJ2188436.1 TetR/AcrR family transcriptional regulator [Novosphingobium beihaiensis]
MSASPDQRAADKPARRKRRTQEERRTETSGRLLDAAIELLLERGYSRFRIADAAKLAGVSRGGQTHHFATKNDLIEAAIERVFQSEVDLAESEAGNAGTEDLLRHGAAHIDAFLASDLYKVSLNMLISAGESEHFADRIRTISARSRKPIESAWIDRLTEGGTDRKKAEDAFWLLWSVQRGISVQRRIGGDPGGTDDILDLTIDLLNGYLRSDEKAAPVPQ